MDTDRARKLRRSMTDAERRLWSGLRDRRLNGLKFRRQQQIGPYFVDFFCHEASLVVEADGSQHQNEDDFWYDYKRTKWIQSAGYAVIRFNNAHILKHPAEVLASIAAAARERLQRRAREGPHPSRRYAAIHLLPEGEGQ